VDNRPVMGIDPSLQGFSTVVLVPNKEPIIHEIKTELKDWGSHIEGRIKRYLTLTDTSVKFAKKYAPRIIVIEGYSYGSKGRGIFQTGELGGILRYRIWNYADICIEVPPKNLKKFVTGNGNASKIQIVQTRSKRYDMIFKTDNEADAFAAAKIGQVLVGYAKYPTKYSEEALKPIILDLETQEKYS